MIVEKHFSRYVAAVSGYDVPNHSNKKSSLIFTDQKFLHIDERCFDSIQRKIIGSIRSFSWKLAALWWSLSQTKGNGMQIAHTEKVLEFEAVWQRLKFEMIISFRAWPAANSHPLKIVREITRFNNFKLNFKKWHRRKYKNKCDLLISIRVCFL